jgi:hypothetical protein
MNFGKWIVVSFILFAIFIGSLVTLCIRQDISLVSKEYYRDELVYQNQMKRISNTEALSVKPVIKASRAGVISVQFAPGEKIQSGTLRLFSPSNAKLDHEFKIESGGTGSTVFKTAPFQTGMYRVKLAWNMNDREYYYEEVIYI